MKTTTFLTREQLTNKELTFKQLGAYDEDNYMSQVYKVLLQDGHAATISSVVDFDIGASAKGFIRDAMLICLDVIEDKHPLENWYNYLDKVGYCLPDPNFPDNEWKVDITLVLAMLEHSVKINDKAHEMFVAKLQNFVAKDDYCTNVYTLLCEKDNEEVVEANESVWNDKERTLFMYYLLNKQGYNPTSDGLTLGFSKLFAKIFGGKVNSYKTYLGKIKADINDFDKDNKMAKKIATDISGVMSDLAQYIENNTEKDAD